jgi:hypothetical protein
MAPLKQAGIGLALTALAACAPPYGGAGSGLGASRTLIDRAEIEAANLTDAFALVQSRRPQWLDVRGPSSLSNGVPRLVYVDNAVLGEVSTLRQINATLVQAIRFWDGPSATQKWGSNHGSGVIQVVTR